MLEKKFEKDSSRFLRLHGKRMKIIGNVSLVLSAILLVAAYFSRYYVFETTSIILLFFGLILILRSVEPYMKTKVANMAVASSLITLKNTMDYLEVGGKAVYLPPSEESGVKMLVSTKNEGILSKNNSLSSKKPLLEPTGSGLLKLCEEEFSSLLSSDLDYLFKSLPRVLVEGLGVAEKVEFRKENETIQVEIYASSFRFLCQEPKINSICNNIGCPIESLIAEALSRCSRSIVHLENCVYEPKKLVTKVTYRLVPR